MKRVAALQQMLAANPGDSLVAFDLAVMLTWVNRPREATEASNAPKTRPAQRRTKVRWELGRADRTLAALL